MVVRFVGCLVALLAVGGAAVKSFAELPPFTRIVNCLPLNVAVRPTQRGFLFDYSLFLQAEDALTDVLKYDVVGGVLMLTLTGDVSVSAETQIAVSLPDNQLTAVENHGTGVVLVEAGFDLKQAGFLGTAGEMRVDDVFADFLTVEASGLGVVAVHGIIHEARLYADGASKLLLDGLRRKAKAEVYGTANIFIQGAKSKRIEGSAHVFGSVHVDATKSCTLASEFFFEHECVECLRSLSMEAAA